MVEVEEEEVVGITRTLEAKCGLAEIAARARKCATRIATCAPRGPAGGGQNLSVLSRSSV